MKTLNITESLKTVPRNTLGALYGGLTLATALTLLLAMSSPSRAEIRGFAQDMPTWRHLLHPAAADSGGGGGVAPDFNERQAEARCKAMREQYTKQISRIEDRSGFAKFGRCADLGWVEPWNPMQATGYYVYSYPYFYVYEVLKSACDPARRNKYAVKSFVVRDYDAPRDFGVGNCYDHGLVANPSSHPWFKRYQLRNVPKNAYWVYAYPHWHVWEVNVHVQTQQQQSGGGNQPASVPTWEPGHKPKSGFWDHLPDSWSQ